MKKTLSFLLITLCALAPTIFAQELQLKTLWEKQAGDFPWLGGVDSNTERGMAYNPTTDHLLIPSRLGNTVQIIEADTGDFVGSMDMSGVSGGTFPINKIGVADDGAIYVGNLTIDALGTDYHLYRWEDEAATPVRVFVGHPGNGAEAPNNRFGDSLAVRGAGENTEILLGTWQGTLLARLTPNQSNLNEADSFSSQVITTDVLANHGRNIVFGDGNIIYITRPSGSESVPGHLYELEMDTVAGTATILREFDGRWIARGLGPMGLDLGSNLFAALRPFSHDILIYRHSQLNDEETTSASWTANFSTTTSNGNGVGEAIVVGNRIFGLHTNNGIIAVELAEPEPLAPGDIFWSTTNAIRTAEIDGSDPRTLISSLGRPIGITIDAANGHIYWAENTGSRIARANLDGTEVTTIVPDRVNPQGIVLVDGRLYWAEWAGGLFSANLDGSDVVHHVDVEDQGTSPVAWDSSTGKVHMVSTGGGEVYTFAPGAASYDVLTTWGTNHYGIAIDEQGVIFRTNFSTDVIDTYTTAEGVGDELYSFREMPLGISLTQDGSQIVWAERHDTAQTDGRIYIANADGSGSVTTLVDGGEISPFGLVVMPSVPEVETFADWIAQQDIPVDQRGPQDDPDGDGIANILEYAFGGDPSVADRSILPVIDTEEDNDNQYLSIAVNRNASADGIQLVIEVSGDLIEWDSGSEHTTVVSDTSELLIVRDNIPMSAENRRFIRVSVIEQ